MTTVKPETMDLVCARFADAMGRAPSAPEQHVYLVRAAMHLERGGVVSFRRFGNACGMFLAPLPAVGHGKRGET